MIVGLSAVLTVVVCDLGLQQLVPLPPPLLEVEDGIADWERLDADVLVVGSSHVRSFVAVRDAVKARGGQREMALVTVEWGTMGSYEWVLDHRLLSELSTRRRLRDVIIVSTFFDLCGTGAVSSRTNLPARAWRLPDFLGSVLREGVTTFNRNYVQRRWNRMSTGSLLVQDRGHGRIVAGLRARLSPRSPEAARASRDAAIDAMRVELGQRHDQCWDAAEREAFERILVKLTGHGLRLTVVAFALVPGAVTPRFEATTLKRYRDYLEGFAARGQVRVVDLSVGSPLVDDDFMADMDHVLPERNPMLAAWLLENGLGFLATPPEGPR